MLRAAAAALLLVVCCGTGGAADGGVTGERCFIDEVWAKDDVVLKKGIAFGAAYNNATQQNETLLLDAYFPPDTDERSRRPVIVLIHGGAFVIGNRAQEEATLAYAFVQRGFVAVSIDYRLTGYYWGAGPACHQNPHDSFMKCVVLAKDGGCPPCENSPRSVVDAAEDGKAAVRFVRKMAAEWRIDTTRVGIAGASAGAITVEWMGYARGAGAAGEGSSGNPGYSSNVSAVVAISGALRYHVFCDSVAPDAGCQGGAPGSGWDHVADITGAGQPALCQVHGTADRTVPYSNAIANKEQADKVGLPNTLITIDGAGHVPQVLPRLMGPRFDELAACLVGAMDLAHAQCPSGAGAAR